MKQFTYPCNAKELAKLLSNTQQLLLSYKVRSRWPQLATTISQLAERYWQLYQQNPSALLAQLALYKHRYDYSTNLVINQVVLSLCFAKALKYDAKISQHLVRCSLTSYLAVGHLANKLATQTPLLKTEKEAWQQRHQLAIKLLQQGELNCDAISHVLAKLNKYKQALLSTPKLMLYDGATTLVALSNIIAMNITYLNDHRHQGFYKAIADIYLRTPNPFAQHALKQLVALVGPYIPGSYVMLGDLACHYLVSDKQGRHTLVDTQQADKIRWHRAKAQLLSEQKQQSSEDNRLLYTVWFHDAIHTQSDTPLVSSEPLYLDLIKQLTLSNEYSFKSLNRLLCNHPDVVTALCQQVKPYNKEFQAAKDLRHALSMVGLFNAPAIIQQVLFKQLVSAIDHPLADFINQRLNNAIAVIALMCKRNEHYHFEHITLALYGYIYFLYQEQSEQLTRRVLTRKENVRDQKLSMAGLFGVSSISTAMASQYLNELTANNPWVDALLESEQQDKTKFSIQAQFWLACKLVIEKVFTQKQTLTTWQKQLLAKQLQLLGWQSERELNEYLSSQPFYDVI